MARIQEVKNLGLDVGIDFHGRLHKGMAKQLARLLEGAHPMFIEEPLLPGHPGETADLAKLVSTPIALGERLFTRADFRPYLEARAIDIAQPDVSGPHASKSYEYVQTALTGVTLRRHQRAHPHRGHARDLRCGTGSSLSLRAYRIGCMHAGRRNDTKL